MANQSTPQQMALDAADGAWCDCVKKAIAIFLDGLVMAGNDAKEKAACRERLMAALTTYRDGYTTSVDVVNQIFPSQAVSSTSGKS